MGWSMSWKGWPLSLMSTIVEEEIGEDSNNNSDNVFQADDVLAIGWRE